MLKINVIEIVCENERGIVDIEIFKEMQFSLIEIL